MSVTAERFAPIERCQRRAWGGAAGCGHIRVVPEDFQVREVPLATPCGAGEHSWLWVRKRDSNTLWVARQLAKYAGLPLSAVSYAGMKDRRAVTEQWFSLHLPGRAEPDWAGLRQAEFQVLSVCRHSRKLKTGTLLGNRFELRIRNIVADRELLSQRLQQLAAGGMPNYFGPQRFGVDGGNLLEAARMFAQPRRRMTRARRGIYLSAVRSALFNRILAARVEDGSWNQVMPGEALQLEGKSACFVVASADAGTRRRAQALEVHPTGPLCGGGETLCAGAAQAFEAAQLEGYQGWIEGLEQARVVNARRALRVVPRDLHWQWQDESCGVLSFYLPAGSYATSLLDELFEVETAA